MALSVAACSPAAGRPAAPGATSAPKATSPDVVRTYAVCFAAGPGAWSQRFQERSLEPAADFHVGAVSGDGRSAFGRYRTSTEGGIGAVDLTTGALSRIAPLPAGAAGVGAMASGQPWLVWDQANSATDLGDWTVRAWNQQSKDLVDVATSRLPDGREVFGQAPLPVVAGGMVAWAQPQPRQAAYPEASVQLYDLARRQLTVLDTGRVSGPVFAGPYLVWARMEADGTYALRAVAAATLKPAALPERVRSPGPVRYLAGSGRYLVWSTDQQQLHAWRVGAGEYGEYTTDLHHPLQFLELAGDFVLWYAGSPSTVLDLHTGHGFDVAGSVAGSDAVIVESEPVRPPATKTDVVPARLSLAPLSASARIEGC